MRDYVSCFNREINGRPVSVNDLKYYAKIEHQRTYKGTDIQVKENQPYATKILELKNELRKIQPGEYELNNRGVTQLHSGYIYQQNSFKFKSLIQTKLSHLALLSLECFLLNAKNYELVGGTQIALD
jgi:hypothetical protein